MQPLQRPVTTTVAEFVGMQRYGDGTPKHYQLTLYERGGDYFIATTYEVGGVNQVVYGWREHGRLEAFEESALVEGAALTYRPLRYPYGLRYVEEFTISVDGDTVSARLPGTPPLIMEFSMENVEPEEP